MHFYDKNGDIAIMNKKSKKTTKSSKITKNLHVLDFINSRYFWDELIQDFKNRQQRFFLHAPDTKKILPHIICMVVIVLGSNILVNFPINNWLTYGAFSYPFSFLVSDLTNRQYGLGAARKVVAFGLIGMGLTFLLASINLWGVGYRIAVAAVLAYIFGQLLDVTFFNRLRQLNWWVAPSAAGLLGALTDSLVFYSLAFYAVLPNWLELSIGDFVVKLATLGFGLMPYRLIIKRYPKFYRPPL